MSSQFLYVLLSGLIALSASAIEQDFTHLRINDINAIADKFHYPRSHVSKNHHIPMSRLEIQGGYLESYLYKKILDELSDRYQSIGRDQSDRVLFERNGFFIAGLNQIGFRYSKDFVDFEIEVQRQLAPDLFDDNRWIVSDQIEMTIAAEVLLNRLVDLDVIDLTQEQFGAFAGLEFKRKYTYVHFADSYLNGLTRNFDRLFFSFLKFRNQDFLSLRQGEYIKRADSLSVHAGAIGAAPIYQSGPVNLTGSFGVLAEMRNLSEVDLYFDQGDLRISLNKEKLRSIGATTSVQIDFLKLIQLTLLSYDFNYSYEKSAKYYLSFSPEQTARLSRNSTYLNAVDDLLNLRKTDLNILLPYQISQERRVRQEINSRYLLLFRGGMRNQKTEHVHIQSTDDNQVEQKTFFRHHHWRSDFEENIISKLFSGVLRRIFDIDQKVDDSFRKTKKISLEYESHKNLIYAREDLILQDDKKNISIRFDLDFFADSRNNGSFASRHRQHLQDILAFQSGADPLIEDSFELEYLTAPVHLYLRYQLEDQAIEYFNDLSSARVYSLIDDLCDNKNRGNGFFRKLFNSCKRGLKNSYDDYQLERYHRPVTRQDFEECHRRFRFRNPATSRNALVQGCLRSRARKTDAQARVSLPLWQLKDFLARVHFKSDHKIDFYHFFGISHVFHYGNIQATAVDQQGQFSSHFQEGPRQGHGVIEDYRQQVRLRAPAQVNP